MGAGGAVAFCCISCSASPEPPDKAAGSGGAASSTQAASSSTGAATSSSTGSGGAGPGSSCADPLPLELGQVTEGNLAVDGQEDHYRFHGRRGQVLQVDIDAMSFAAVPFDPRYIDSVVTLFHGDGSQLAQNNNDLLDALATDSRFQTILPADGEYCLRVTDCSTLIERPENNCATGEKLFTRYELRIDELTDEPLDSNTTDLGDNDGSNSATPVTYVNQGGSYGTSSLWGTFQDPADVDLFSFTVPLDLVAQRADVRAAAYFYITPSGLEGNGSTAPTGRISVVDPGAPEVSLAEIEGANSTLLVAPVEPGKERWLVVRRAGDTAGASDFYFLHHALGWGLSLETERGSGENDSPETAAPIQVVPYGVESPIAPGSKAEIEGDLASVPEDRDHFAMDVPAGLPWVSARCDAHHHGSGLRGFRVSLLTEEGDLLAPLSTSLEEAHEPTRIRRSYTGGLSRILLKLEAASQDVGVTSSFYRCSVYFYPRAWP
ncbi:hypothetical protein [Sorangium cellulosum]|nr:hypothetical protein [Sorangium cellulosum]